MAEGKIRHDWDQSAIIWAAIANQFANEKTRVLPSVVHPLRDESAYKPKPIVTNDITVLKAMLE